MNIKKIIAGICALTLIGGVLPSAAPMKCTNLTSSAAEEEVKTGEIEDLWYLIEDGKVTITGCDQNVTDLVIPAEIEGCPVTSIGTDAFNSHKNLISVIIPDTVKIIYSFAFQYCKNLTSITIPDSVTEIGVDAFEGTPWLESQKEKDPLVIGGKVIINGQNCSGDLVIPDGVEYIRNNAFEGSTLTSVTIPDGVTSIREFTFSKCKDLTSVTLPSTLEYIDKCVFDSCENLTSIIIPESVEDIGSLAFHECTSLTSITISEGVKRIDFCAFSGCTSLASITIPESVEEIGLGVFGGCSNLTSITIKNKNCQLDEYFLGLIDDPNKFSDEHSKCVIYGCKDSTAQAFAEKYGIKFEALPEKTTLPLGDPTGDGTIDSSDASAALAEYAAISTGEKSTLTAEQLAAADVNKDGKVDATDASMILEFYAYTSTGGKVTDMQKWIDTERE